MFSMLGLNNFWGNNFSVVCDGHEIIWHSYYHMSSVLGLEFLYPFPSTLSFLLLFFSWRSLTPGNLIWMFILCDVLSIHCHTCYVSLGTCLFLCDHIVCELSESHHRCHSGSEHCNEARTTNRTSLYLAGLFHQKHTCTC